MVDKPALRRHQRALRAELSDRVGRSARAVEHVLGSPEWAGAACIGLYRSMHTELATGALLGAAWRTGRRVALPVVVGRAQPLRFHEVGPETPLIRSGFGVEEPAGGAVVEPDVLLVPGLAWDRSGGRLGYGGGFYDRTLTALGATAVLLAFADQELDRVPMQAHDVRMDAVVTELGWRRELEAPRASLRR